MSDTDLSERLQYAITQGDQEDVRALLGRGADLHQCGSYNALPLTLAARYNNPVIIDILLEAGAEINAADSDGYTALMEAANCMVSGSLKLLIKHGAKVNAQSESGATPLIYGVFALGEDFAIPAPDDIVALLLADGADLMVRNAEGKSALDIAVETGNEGLVGFLLEAGAS